MFSTKSLNAKKTESTEVELWKKRNFFHTTLNKLNGIFSNQHSLLPAISLVKNLLVLNNSLSVTLVSNGGIIPPDFFQSITSNREYRLKLKSTNLLQQKFFKRSIHSLMDKDYNYFKHHSNEENGPISHKKKEIFSKEGISVDHLQNSQLNDFEISKDKISKKSQNLKVRRKTNFISKHKKFYKVIRSKHDKLKYSSMRDKFLCKVKSKIIVRSRLTSESSIDSEDSFIVFTKESKSANEEEVESEIENETSMRKGVKHLPEKSIKEQTKDCKINKRIVQPKLSSESSINSVPSFIVFQEDSKSDKEIESSLESDWKTESDSENEFENNVSQPKVHFNLIPIIHNIDYEPCVPFSRWMEEMRRFRERIRETELILQPVLTFHHRAEIFKKLFSNEE